ncbi:MAG: hypothetical protein GY708_21925 [Actinomycetia bacterium]|nr:hypothetical protein [Actinomycetes bacterium]
MVDLIDLTYVAGHIGTSERRADFNGDGTVDQIDSDMLGAVYGTTCGTRLIGDTNGDGLVNLIDLAYLAAQMGTSDPVADFNGDGTVDQIDVDMLGANYGRNLGRRFLGDVNGDNIVDLIDLVTLSRALRPNHPLGDLNGDFVVDQVDVDLLGAQYGSISGADLLGDINGDKIVDQIDVDLLAAVYGTNWPQADINDDGTVDLIDFTMLSGEVGNIAARDLTGDVNGDWLVDQVDADLLGAVYGTSWPQADIDDSGVVDLIDLTLLSQNMDATFGTQCMGNINGDGEVDGTDLGILSAVYGTEYPQADLDGVPPVDIIDLTLLAQNTGNLCP